MAFLAELTGPWLPESYVARFLFTATVERARNRKHLEQVLLFAFSAYVQCSAPRLPAPGLACITFKSHAACFLYE